MHVQKKGFISQNVCFPVQKTRIKFNLISSKYFVLSLSLNTLYINTYYMPFQFSQMPTPSAPTSIPSSPGIYYIFIQILGIKWWVYTFNFTTHTRLLFFFLSFNLILSGNKYIIIIALLLRLCVIFFWGGEGSL